MSVLLDHERPPVDIDQHSRAQNEPTDSRLERSPEQRLRDLDICVEAHDHCADPTDRVAAEDEYVMSHGDTETLALMRLIRAQAQTARRRLSDWDSDMAARDGTTVEEYRARLEALGDEPPPFVVSYVPDPRVAELQKAYAQACYREFVAQLEEARRQLSSTFERVIASLNAPPFEMDGLHAAIEAGDARTLLYVAARSAFICANASHKQIDILVSRVLRGTIVAIESAGREDLTHLKDIAKAAEPEPRDMHATERSEMRVETLDHMHQRLGVGLAKLWGAITVDDLVQRHREIERRYGIALPNAERAAREEIDAFRPERAAGALAQIFVGSVQLIPEVFVDRGIPFSTEERYTPEGAIDGSPDPQKLKPVEAAYLVRIETWESTRDMETITDRAIDLIEEGLKALGMNRKRDADAVVSFLRKRKDRAMQKRPTGRNPESEPDDRAP